MKFMGIRPNPSQKGRSELVHSDTGLNLMQIQRQLPSPNAPFFLVTKTPQNPWTTCGRLNSDNPLDSR
jgi:hypothetical protein